jgi:hypothetical protein
MKLRLLILLAAAALAAAPAAGQTIKSLGYNTTNGNIVAATNVTFTNSVGFATNARAATRTNLGGTTVGNSVFTATNAEAARTAISAAAADGFGVVSNAYKAGILVDFTDGAFGADALSYADGVWAVSNPTNFRTNLGLGAGDNVTFSNITANGILNANDSSATPATNAAAAQGIQWSGLGGSQHAAIYGGYPGTAQIALAVGASSNALSDVATFRSTGMTVASNAVVGGTLAVTGNATLNGVGNTAPSQTASSASSLMTRELNDFRLFGMLAFYDPRRPDIGTVTLTNGAVNDYYTSLAQREMQTGTNAAGAAVFTSGYSVKNSAAQNLNWAGRVVVSWQFKRTGAYTSEVRLQFGRAASATTHAALTARGVGIRITQTNMFFETHNGTTGFETTNSVALPSNEEIFWVDVQSGVARFYRNHDTLMATVTNNVPFNNDALSSEGGWTASISNTSTINSMLTLLQNPGFVLQQ